MTVDPSATADTVAPFRDEAIYSFHFDTSDTRREDLSFKVRFGAPTRSREFEIRRAEPAPHGLDDEVLVSGSTESPASGAADVRAFAGVVNDPFAGDAVALVLEVPNHMIADIRKVNAWATVSLYADPTAYARRVADLFGTLTLPYELGSAASFDYAGFNGRTLHDNVMDVMLTILTNSPLGTGIRPDPTLFDATFPYLRR